MDTDKQEYAANRAVKQLERAVNTVNIKLYYTFLV